VRTIITGDYKEMALTAAAIVEQAVRAKPDAVLGLPTGNTPRGLYSELVRRHREEGLKLSAVRTFNLDELIGLGARDSLSYRAYMQVSLFRHVDVLPENIHIPRGASGTDFEEESKAYECEIRQAGGVDLLVCGVGTNGHIAFNEPGSAFDSRTRAVDLAPETLNGLRIQFPDETELPRRAITMGIGTILEARRVICLASGQRKAVAVARALDGPVTVGVPASALQLHADTTVILDREAASLLGRPTGKS
jgi:glucosamine-6-phosphate deaminase